MLKFLKNTSGATAIEYGIIASLASIAIISALLYVSDQVKLSFSKVGSAMGSSTGTSQ